MEHEVRLERNEMGMIRLMCAIVWVYTERKNELEKALRERRPPPKAAYYPHMALLLVSLPSYPENFINIR